jgi:adenylosuccinate lyase
MLVNIRCTGLHRRICSIEATAGVKAGTATTRDLIAKLQQDAAFKGLNFADELDPARYIGRSPEQTDEFTDAEVKPIRERYALRLGQRGEVNV